MVTFQYLNCLTLIFPHFHVPHFHIPYFPHLQPHVYGNVEGYRAANVEMWKVGGCKYRNVESWGLHMRKCGNVEVGACKCEDAEMWKVANMGMWKYEI